MSDELLKWLVSSGIGGVIGVLAILEIRATRRELREEMRASREESAAADEKNNGWLIAIHSRLGTLGADSVPPPIPDEKRRRLRTAPAGVPIRQPRDTQED